MKTRVEFKNLYLIAIITIGLIGLGVGSTLAMFDISASIDNPIAFNSNLVTNNLLAETVEVAVPSGEDKEVELEISNSFQEALHYTAWYMSSSNDLEVGSLSSNNSYGTVGLIPSDGSFTLTVQLRNNGNTPITVTIGVSSSASDIVLPSSVARISLGTLPANRTTLAQYITDLYNVSSKDIVQNGTINYNYATSVSLMNDRLGTMDTSINGGNIRYYGSNPNNYIDLGEVYNDNYVITGTINYGGYSDFSECVEANNQDYCSSDINITANTNKLYRIIGVFDDKVKVVSADPIGFYAWDTVASNVWVQSELLKILNTGYENQSINNSLYWNKTSGTYLNESVDFSVVGLNTGVRNIISSNDFYPSEYTNLSGEGLAAFTDTYSSDLYVAERNNTSYNSKVGLIYASDFGYSYDFSTCSYGLTVLDTDDENIHPCSGDSWLEKNYSIWTMTSYKDTANSSWIVNPGGLLKPYNTDKRFAIFPTFYLSSNVLKTGGSGTMDNPYVIN